MRIFLVEKGSTTVLYAPATLAGLVFALKDHFDNIERGYISIVFDKRAEREWKNGGGEFIPLFETGGEETKPPGKG